MSSSQPVTSANGEAAESVTAAFAAKCLHGTRDIPPSAFLLSPVVDVMLVPTNIPSALNTVLLKYLEAVKSSQQGCDSSAICVFDDSLDTLVTLAEKLESQHGNEH